MVAEQPDDPAARRNQRMLVDPAAQANDAEDFVFLKRKAHKSFPRYVKSVAANMVLKVNARIEFDARAGVIVHNIFNCHVTIGRLQVIWQTVVRAAKIETLVFNAKPEIPLTGNEEAMVVTKIIVERIAATKFAVIVAEIAAERVEALRGKKIVRIFVFRRGSGLRLVSALRKR